MLTDPSGLVRGGLALMVALVLLAMRPRFRSRVRDLWILGWSSLGIGSLVGLLSRPDAEAGAGFIPLMFGGISLALSYTGLGLILAGAYEAVAMERIRSRVFVPVLVALAALGAVAGIVATLSAGGADDHRLDGLTAGALASACLGMSLFMLWVERGPRSLGQWMTGAATGVYGLLLLLRAMMSEVGSSLAWLRSAEWLGATDTVVLAALAMGTLIWSLDPTEDEKGDSEDTRGLHDELTGLPNRRLFMRRLRDTLETSEERNVPVGVMLVGLDRFKVINESMGHHIADEVLKVVATRLRQSTRSHDTVARVSGDEFALIFPEVSPQIGAINLAEKLLDLVRQPVVVEGRELLLTASIGGAFHPFDADEPDLLTQHAATAMEKAKNRGRDGYRLYTPDMDSETTTQFEFELDLRRAVDKKVLSLYYQPIIDRASGKVCMFEALLRWPHAEKGLLLPDSFLAVAQNLGLSDKIDEWVLGAACEQIQEWRTRFDRDVGLAVNLSADPFQRKDLATFIATILDRTGLEPDALELEITEHTAMLDFETGIRTLNILKQLGIDLAIDDFGTGYSSFTNLRRFPVDKIKIDKSFVRDLLVDQGDTAIVAALISLAHSLGLKVVAEGVESAEQAAFLTELSCDHLQGFHFFRPLAPEDCEARILSGELVLAG